MTNKTLDSIVDDYINKMQKLAEKRLEHAKKDYAYSKQESVNFTQLCQDIHDFKHNNPKIEPNKDPKDVKRRGDTPWGNSFNFKN